MAADPKEEQPEREVAAQADERDFPAFSPAEGPAPTPSTAGAAAPCDAAVPMDEEDQMVVRAGIRRFNQHPKKGVQWLEEQGVLTHTPEDYAHFLTTARGISKAQLGEYLASVDPFILSVVEAALNNLNFAGLDLVSCLYAFLGIFRLPTEITKMEGVLQLFGKKFWRENPGVFVSEETPYVLAFGCLMLSTDLHTTAWRRRGKSMDEAAHRRAYSNVKDGGKDLDPEFLNSIYRRIEGCFDLCMPRYACLRDPLKTGWLTVPGFWILPWSRRWVVLASNMSLYLGDQEGMNWSTHIPLDGLMVRPVVGGKQWAFELYHHLGEKFVVNGIEEDYPREKERVASYVVAAENEAGMLTWLEALNEVLLAERDVEFERKFT